MFVYENKRHFMLLVDIPCRAVKLDKYYLLLMLCMFGLFGCESDDNQSMQTGEIVKIGRLICGGHLPLAIVEKKYQQNLKSFKLQSVQKYDWGEVIAEIKSGELAGTFILSPLAMNLIHDGFSGKIVLMSNRNGNGFILAKKFKSIEELKETRSIIAVPHMYSQHHVLLHTVLQQHDIPAKNIKVLGMPPRDMINSLRNGEIDGFVVGEPEGNRSINLGVGWMAAISPQIWKDHMDHVFIVADDFINEQPDKLQKLVNELVRAGEFIENNAYEAAVMGEDCTGTQAKIFEKVLTIPADRISYKNMMVSEKDIQEMSEKLVEMELWEKIPDHLNENYFDMSFVIRAEKTMRNK